MTPFLAELIQDRELYQKHCLALQSDIDALEDADTFYKWMGSVFNANAQELKGKRPVTVEIDNEEEKDDAEIRTEFQEVYDLLTCVKQQLEDLAPVRLAAAQAWKAEKAAMGDAEYRRNKHKFKKVADKIDERLPSLERLLESAANKCKKKWMKEALALPPSSTSENAESHETMSSSLNDLMKWRASLADELTRLTDELQVVFC